MPLTRSRERHTVIPAVRSTAVQFLTSVQPIKIIRVLQYQPIKTRVKETEKPDSYRRTTRSQYKKQVKSDVYFTFSSSFPLL